MIKFVFSLSLLFLLSIKMNAAEFRLLEGIKVEHANLTDKLLEQTNGILNQQNQLLAQQNAILNQALGVYKESEQENVYVSRCARSNCAVFLKLSKDICIWSKNRLRDGYILGGLIVTGLQLKWNERNKKKA